MKKAKKIIIAMLAVYLFFGASIMGLHLYVSHQVDAEWREKIPKAMTGADRRSVIDGMVKHRKMFVPSFIPKRFWDDDICAGSVINAINWLMADEAYIKTAPAWQFAGRNAEKLEKVYDRSKDFAFEEKRLVEKYDRPINLSRTLNMGKDERVQNLYVVGYNYHGSETGPTIVEQGGTINSHLLLLLGRYDGSWWGYHLFHDPRRLTEDPFRVENLGEDLPAKFDLIYIWRVKGATLRQGTSSKVAVQDRLYREVKPLLGLSPIGGHLGRSVDHLMVHFFSRGENFPRLVDEKHQVVELVKPGASAPHGRLLGFYKGVPIFRHGRGRKSRRGTFGLEYQCVELANRFLALAKGFKNLSRTGHADTYFYQAREKGMVPHYNGSKTKPRADDLIIFDPEGEDSVPGHVAVITKVTRDKVCLVQQNAESWRECLPLTRKSDGGWFVKGRVMPCTGWARP